ncbi:threonine synthase, partial [candidate division WOR-3 bacterium]|nr:threonine synthase [candidate division WOR-3 bacterium]
MKSYVDHLECTKCGNKVEADRLWNLCTFCGKPLVVLYDLKQIRKDINKETFKSRPPTLWRYQELLPIKAPNNILTLGEGFTPLHTASRLGQVLNFQNLFIKDESQNPTGSFKARGMAVAVSRARELGIREIAMPSAGNAAGALSAYAAQGGLRAYVYMPRDVPKTFIVECIALGAQVQLVEGLITECGRHALQDIAQFGRFDMSTLKEPYRIEGKKTMGLELAEQLDWHLPDVIIYPTGGGTGLIGMWKAFEELKNLGWIKGKLPRMVVVQASGCAPIVKAFNEKKETADPWRNAKTIADGLRVPVCLGDFMILRTLRESHGTALAVPDDEMLECV